MTAVTLAASRIRAGFWEGLLRGTGPRAPAIEVVHDERPLAGVEVVPAPNEAGHWAARAPIPVVALSDGVQTFLVRDSQTGDEIGSFSIVTGDAAEADLRAEVDLLRAELDMLKKAFRAHCRETGG